MSPSVMTYAISKARNTWTIFMMRDSSRPQTSRPIPRRLAVSFYISRFGKQRKPMLGKSFADRQCLLQGTHSGISAQIHFRFSLLGFPFLFAVLNTGSWCKLTQAMTIVVSSAPQVEIFNSLFAILERNSMSWMGVRIPCSMPIWPERSRTGASQLCEVKILRAI